MIKKFMLVIVIFLSLCLTGCGKNDIDSLGENIKKMELTGNLVTYKAYYHNVIEYEKKAGTGITHIFEKDRKLFVEYTGTIKLGIDLSKVKITVSGNEVNVFLPSATIIGEPNVDKDDFKEENFIESKDGINSNKITMEDSSMAFDEAQKNIKEITLNDRELLLLAQKRAKVIIEENIKQFALVSSDKYVINFEYEQ